MEEITSAAIEYFDLSALVMAQHEMDSGVKTVADEKLKLAWLKLRDAVERYQATTNTSKSFVCTFCGERFEDKKGGMITGEDERILPYRCPEIINGKRCGGQILAATELTAV